MRRYGSGARRIPRPVVIKPPKLNVSGLKAAYEWMAVDKLLGFRLAFEWYAQAVAPSDGKPSPLLFQDPLDTERQKTYDRAVKAKTLGDSTPIAEERDHAWTTALTLYQRVWEKRALPKIEEATERPSRRMLRLRDALAAFNGAFAPSTFGVTLGEERDVATLPASDSPTPAARILLPQGELEKLAAEPPLRALLALAPSVAQGMSIVRDVEGNEQLNGESYFANLPRVLCGVYDWAAANVRTCFRATGRVPVVSASAVAAPAAAARTTPDGDSTVRVLNPVLQSKGARTMRMWGYVWDNIKVSEFRAVCKQHNEYGPDGFLRYLVAKGVVEIQR